MKFTSTRAFSIALSLLVSSSGTVADNQRGLRGPSESDVKFPDSFRLPDGFRPEGSVAGTGTEIYVSCTRGPQVGFIWKGDVSTGEGSVLIPPTGDPTRGIALDQQGRLWVAWKFGGRVYDSSTGDLLKEYTFELGTNSVINDVIVGKDKVIFTDSGSSIPNGRQETGIPRLFIVELGAGASQDLPDEFTEVRASSADLNLDSGYPTLNGIETVPADTSKVIACHTNLGLLVNIDLVTGETTEVDVGDVNRPFSTCDGLVRRGSTLYVVRNRDTIVSKVSLDPRGTSGVIETMYDLNTIISYPNLGTTTTGALYGDYLYMPDSRFRLDCSAVDCNTAPFSVYGIKLN